MESAKCELFKDIQLHSEVSRAVIEFGFTKLTPVQVRGPSTGYLGFPEVNSLFPL